MRGLLGWADLEDHTGARELNQRCICRVKKAGAAGPWRWSTARIPDRAVIDDIGAAIRPEPDISWTIEPSRVGRADERLIAGIVAREVLEAELQRTARVLIEVDQLDFVSHFRRRRRRIRRREPEIAFEAIESRTRQHRAGDKRLRRK